MPGLEAETERSKYAEAGKRPPKGIRIAARRYRSEQRQEKESRLRVSNKSELSPETINSLSDIRNRAVLELKRSHDPLNISVSQLQIVWARARSAKVRPGTVERRVVDLIEQLHDNGNDQLSETVGLDEHKRPIPRYRWLLEELNTQVPFIGVNSRNFRKTLSLKK